MLLGAFLCDIKERALSAVGETRVQSTTREATQFGSLLRILGLIAVFTFVWTVYPVLTRLNLDPYGDMLENYAWGIGWQWGYFKHPPFFAWITAAWFKVFPHVDWAYYLLSAANAGLAVFLSWRIATRFLDPWRSFLAAALFFFLPPVTFLAAKFNANAALLPLWPLTVLFYLRFLESRKLADAIILGLVAAIAMLTKYFSAVLLASIVLHILVDREARQLLRRPASWVAAGVFLAAFSPHVMWLVKEDFLPVAYAASQGDGSMLEGFTSGLRFVGAMILYALPAGIVLCIMLMRNRVGVAQFFDGSGLRRFADTVQGRALVWTTFGSIGVTLVVGILLGTRLSSVWALPMFFSLPVFLLAPIAGNALEGRREIVPLVITVYCIGLLASGLIIRNVEDGEEKHYSHIPIAAVANALETAWAQQTDAPLMYVAGDKALSSGASFYGTSRPYAVIENSLRFTPWIKPEDLTQSGLAAACLEGQAECESALAAFPVHFQETRTVAVQGEAGRVWNVRLHIALPAEG